MEKSVTHWDYDHSLRGKPESLHIHLFAQLNMQIKSFEINMSMRLQLILPWCNPGLVLRRYRMLDAVS
jgi:hypothetical protein